MGSSGWGRRTEHWRPGISAALGPPPADPADALRRELAVRELPIEFQPHRTIDRAIEGPALTLD